MVNGKLVSTKPKSKMHFLSLFILQINHILKKAYLYKNKLPALGVCSAAWEIFFAEQSLVEQGFDPNVGNMSDLMKQSKLNKHLQLRAVQHLYHSLYILFTNTLGY